MSTFAVNDVSPSSFETRDPAGNLRVLSRYEKNSRRDRTVIRQGLRIPNPQMVRWEYDRSADAYSLRTIRSWKGKARTTSRQVRLPAWNDLSTQTFMAIAPDGEPVKAFVFSRGRSDDLVLDRTEIVDGQRRFIKGCVKWELTANGSWKASTNRFRLRNHHARQALPPPAGKPVLILRPPKIAS